MAFEAQLLTCGYRESQEVLEEAWHGFSLRKDDVTLLEAITRSIHRMELLREPF